MVPRLAFLVALGVALLLVAASALAQDDSRSQAKLEFAAGQKAFDARDYAEALSHFRKAFELHRHDAVRFNIAVCLERLGRNREAMIEYESAAKSDQLDEGARARAGEQASQARSRLGTLAVEGKPAGADVIVDGAELCNLPCNVQLDPTRHEVVIKSGAASEKRSVEIVKQETRRITVELGGGEQTGADPQASAGETPKPERVEGEHSVSKAGGGGPGWLTWTGVGLVVVGGAGIAVFGPKAKSAHDDWVDSGDPSARDDGLRARNLTNVSIGVAVLGAVAIGVDLLILAPKRGRHAETGRVRSRGFSLEF